MSRAIRHLEFKAGRLVVQALRHFPSRISWYIGQAVAITIEFHGDIAPRVARRSHLDRDRVWTFRIAT